MFAPIDEAPLTVSEDSSVTPPTVPPKVTVPPVSTRAWPPSTVLLKAMPPPLSVPLAVSVTLPP